MFKGGGGNHTIRGTQGPARQLTHPAQSAPPCRDGLRHRKNTPRKPQAQVALKRGPVFSNRRVGIQSEKSVQNSNWTPTGSSRRLTAPARFWYSIMHPVNELRAIPAAARLENVRYAIRDMAVLAEQLARAGQNHSAAQYRRPAEI